MSAPLRLLVLSLLVGVCVFAPEAHAEPLTPEERHAITTAYLEGNLETVRVALRDVEDPDALLPLAILEHFWRGEDGVAAQTDPERLAARSSGLLQRRYAWLAGDRLTSFPMGAQGEHDGWPMIAALVLDRMQREEHGLIALREKSVLASVAAAMDKAKSTGALQPHEENQLWWVNHTRDDLSFLYEGAPETAESRAKAEDAAGIATRNLLLALLAVFLLCGVPVWIERRASR